MSRNRADSRDEQRFHKATPIELTHMVTTPVLEEWVEPGSKWGPEPGSSMLIRDLQTELNDARPAGAGDGAEATCERPCAVYFARGIFVACGKERRLQAGAEHVARRIVNVAIEHVEERGLEIDCGFFADQMGFLPNREVFIPPAKRARR